MRTENFPFFKKARFHDPVAALFLFGVCVFIYFPALDNYFLLDDGQWLLLGKRVLEGGGVFELVGGAYFEPVLNVFLGVCYLFFHLNPAGYYAVNLVLHAVNTVLLYFASRLLFPGEKAGAILASLLFAALYAHHQPVLWIAAFVHLVSALFVTGGFIFFLLYAQTGRMSYYYVCLVVFAAGLLAKESVVMLPVVLALYAALFPGARKTRVTWRRLLPFFVLAFAAFSFYLARGISVQTHYGGHGYALGLHFFPASVSSFIEIVFSTLGYITLFGRTFGAEAFTVNGALLLLIFCFSILRAQSGGRRDPSAVRCMAFGMACFFVLLLPFAFFREMLGYGSFHRYRYLYLPSIGFCLGAGHFLSFLMRRTLADGRLKWSAALPACVILHVLFLNVKHIRLAEGYYSFYGRVSENRVAQIGKWIAGKKPSELYLLDFPETPVLSSSLPHMESLVRLFYGEEWSVFMMREEELKTFLPEKNTYLVYRQGRVEAYGER